MYKESYFSPACKDALAQRLLRDLTGYERHPGPVNPWSEPASALLVMDMQSYFLDPSSHACVPSAPDLLPGILGLIGAFRSRNRPVLFTRHGNDPADGTVMNRWWGGVLVRGSRHWNLDPVLQAQVRNGELLDKTQYDAFWETELDGRLQAAGVRELHICGVMTHLCCETTARAAFVRNYDPVMVADATATYHYDLHLGSLRCLAHGFARMAWTAAYTTS